MAQILPFLSNHEIGEATESQLGNQEMAKPPDAEKLLEGSQKTYEFALEYWQTHLGKKRSDVPFKGQTFAQRKSLIEVNLNKLQSNDEREDSDHQETSQDEPVDRETLIIQTTELILEQVLADMVDARKQFEDAAGLIQKFQQQVRDGELADLSLLESARAAVFDLHASAITLEHFLARAGDDVKCYEEFSRHNDLSEQYTDFMRSSLEEYRVQSESTFASDQEQSQLAGAFEGEVEKLTNSARFGELLQAITERIESEKNKAATESEPAEEIEAETEQTPEEAVTAPEGSENPEELLDDEDQQPGNDSLLRLVKDTPREQRKDKAA